jgi:drug/metabolite transporter superfamily protein YnfA
VGSSATSLLAQRPARSPLSAGEIIGLLLLLGLTPLFFISGPAWLTTDTGRALANLAHVGVFALITLLMQGRIDLSRPRRWLLLTALVAAVSLAIELIQSQVGRSASWHDGLRNLTGTWLAIFWLQRPTAAVWAGRLLASSLLIIEIALVAMTAAAEQRMIDQLPLLSGMESKADVARWQGIASEVSQSGEVATEGDFSLQARLSTAAFTGISLSKLPNDWSEYSTLTFELYNPQSEDLPMTIRIHDAHHELSDQRWRFEDRFNKRIVVQPGWNHFEISLREVHQAPESRSMDLGLIKELRLFAAGLGEPKVIHADNFRFE